MGGVARIGMLIRFIRSGSVAPKLAAAWFGAGGVSARCEAGAGKDAISGVRAPRPQNSAAGSETLEGLPEGGPGSRDVVRIRARRWRTILNGWNRPVLLAAALLLAGCAASPAVVNRAPAPMPARLTIINLTPRAWQVAAVATVGGEPRVVRVEPHAKLEWELAQGDYSIEQTLLAPSGQAEATRRLPVFLEAGQSYQWPLATLEDEIPPGDFAAERNGTNHQRP
jgi:hypothetical protein